MKIRRLLRCCATALLVLAVQSVSAHTALKQATPAADAIVAVAPATIELLFTEPVKLVKLQVMAADKEMVTSFAPNATAQAAFTIETPGLQAGAVTVNWAVVGADGHAINNSFHFTIDPNLANSAALRQ